jgi:hypothetical protein
MKFYTHPLRDGVTLILEKHFAPNIVKKFKLIFEAQAFTGKNIMNQIKDDKLALEVYYDNGDTTEYVCDVWSYMNKKQAEYHLLNRITDCVKAGKFGTNWLEGKDGIISEEVLSEQFLTPDSEIEKGMA